MKLPYKIEVKSTRPCYELIAAFDCEAAAVGYAGDCALANPNYHYAVKRGRVLIRHFGPER